jgi:hypothetical protein
MSIIIIIIIIIITGRESAVGIATGYGLEGRGTGVRIPVGGKTLLHIVQTGSGVQSTHFPIQCVRGIFSPEANRPKREADN